MNRDEIRELAAQLYRDVLASEWPGHLIPACGPEEALRRLAIKAFDAAEAFAKVASERPETKP